MPYFRSLISTTEVRNIRKKLSWRTITFNIFIFHISLVDIIYLINLFGIICLFSLFGIWSRSHQFQSMGACVGVQAGLSSFAFPYFHSFLFSACTFVLIICIICVKTFPITNLFTPLRFTTCKITLCYCSPLTFQF